MRTRPRRWSQQRSIRPVRLQRTLLLRLLPRPLDQHTVNRKIRPQWHTFWWGYSDRLQMGTVTQTASPRQLPIYNSKGNIVGMHQVPATPNIPRRKTGHQTIHRNLGASVLEDQDKRSSGSGSNYESEPEGQLCEDYSTSKDELEEEALIPNPSLCSLGFETMLRSVLPPKKMLRRLEARRLSSHIPPELMQDVWLKMVYPAPAQHQPPSGSMVIK